MLEALCQELVLLAGANLLVLFSVVGLPIVHGFLPTIDFGGSPTSRVVLSLTTAVGGRQIAYRAEEAMHAFWGVLEWGANTILFVWMGIVLAIVLPPSHEHTQISSLPIQLEARDAGYVVVLYLWLQVMSVFRVG